MYPRIFVKIKKKDSKEDFMKSKDQRKLNQNIFDKFKLFPLKIPNRISNKLESETAESNSSFNIKEFDQSPFFECDDLISDIDNFCKVSEETINIINQSEIDKKQKVLKLPFKSNINKWRAKRKGNSLFSVYEDLNQKIPLMNKKLEELNIQTLKSSSGLISQSTELSKRLKSCVKYNSTYIEQNKAFIENMSSYLYTLKESERSLDFMLTFYDEITELKSSQIKWGLTDDDYQSPSIKRSSILKRLKRIRLIIDLVEKVFQSSKRPYDRALDDLNHSKKAILVLENLVNKIIKSSVKFTGDQLTFLKNIDYSDYENDALGPTLASPNKCSFSPGTPQSNTSTPNSRSGSISRESFRGIERGSDCDSIRSVSKDSGLMNFNMYENNKSKVINSIVTDLSIAPFPQELSKDFSIAVDEVKEKNQINTIDSKREISNSIKEETSHYSESIDNFVDEYDHSNCTDCSVVYDMANDCSMHLAALQYFGQESRKRLKVLDLKKDDLLKQAKLLEDKEWGGSNSTIDLTKV